MYRRGINKFFTDEKRMKKNSLSKRIVDYARNKYYFSLKDLQNHFVQNNIEYTKENLKKSIYRMRLSNFIYDSGRGWYSTIKKEFKLDTEPVEKTMKLLNKKFPLLEYSCWSTEQLKSFFHHLPTQFATFIFSDKDFLVYIKDFLEDKDFNVYLNPQKSEVEKFVHFKEKNAVLRPSITYREPKSKHFAKIEKIIVDLYMEAKKIKIIDLEEYKRIVSNIIGNYRINMSKMLEYAERRGLEDKIEMYIKKI